ncbi:Dna2/Cas4 domain-containing protein [Anaerotignum lactatifermentans]|uniref:Dna2/Cas4 domain-containing protein n=1 Tax=Anaerotignum lactatifermentans TaxID=160404 RepID=A0ABS2G887_9FIRM|nr:Dna2/Cas4 domain-containing protein [Anaerotignum lactatifermentans]MBM6828849.1 Dna2/Cas4 domain-containing protein [Anaerotignum lactatifermentans]MBM6876978.1 Dna2/Cas4 domain-containing protein [Anaerotignum lactatifermentans]MBM6950536.1 Dna2/Cas4 domain-containing protein [Anaerotignum lactatifermentans]
MVGFEEWFSALRWTDFLTVGILLAVFLLLAFRLRRPALMKMPLADRTRGLVLIYADQKQEGRADFGKLLYSGKYDLRGKPDYVFRRRFGRAIIPVEIKSGRIGQEEVPHRGDLLQLYAYFLLLEDVFGRRPKYGWLEYQDSIFFVRNTSSARREALGTMKEMRQMLATGKGTPRAEFAVCRYCVCNGTVCPYAKNTLTEE